MKWTVKLVAEAEQGKALECEIATVEREDQGQNPSDSPSRDGGLLLSDKFNCKWKRVEFKEKNLMKRGLFQSKQYVVFNLQSL